MWSSRQRLVQGCLLFLLGMHVAPVEESRIGQPLAQLVGNLKSLTAAQVQVIGE
jgi:hypothetical protein